MVSVGITEVLAHSFVCYTFFCILILVWYGEGCRRRNGRFLPVSTTESRKFSKTLAKEIIIITEKEKFLLLCT